MSITDYFNDSTNVGAKNVRYDMFPYLSKML